MRRGTGAAFTLIELLVGLVLTTGLAAALVAVGVAVTEVWHRVGGGLAAEVQATAALDRLERDLRSLLTHPQREGAWLAVSREDESAALLRRGWSLAGRPKPTSRRGGAGIAGIGARFGRSGAWLRFFTTAPESSSYLPVAVGYQVIRWWPGTRESQPRSAGPRYVLCRTEIDPGRTWRAGFDLAAAPYRATASGRPSSLERPIPAADVLASSVIDFGVGVGYVDLDGRERRLFPLANEDDEFALVASPVGASALCVDVMVRVATEEGARRLAKLELEAAGSMDTATFEERWWQTAHAFSRARSRRILVYPGGR